MKLYQAIASKISAVKSLTTRAKLQPDNMSEKNREWLDKHQDALDAIAKNLLLSGSGIDSGTSIISGSHTRIVLRTAFHHMTEHGMYDGWTEHDVIVTPSFDGIDLRITGRNRNGIKEYLHDTFHHVLTQEYEEPQA